MGHFRNLQVWQESVDLAEGIYLLTKRSPFVKDYGLCNQIQRAVVSIASNIAECEQRGSDKDSIRFLFFARGSVAELMTQLEISRRIGYINEDTCIRYTQKSEKINAYINKLIKAKSRVHDQTVFQTPYHIRVSCAVSR